IRYIKTVQNSIECSFWHIIMNRNLTRSLLSNHVIHSPNYSFSVNNITWMLDKAMITRIQDARRIVGDTILDTRNINN
ncbi:hypothetical protein D3G70_17045, partial [Escherichia coli]|nr:hypothetical protein [Escherichia coli]